MATIIDLMFYISDDRKYMYYHKDTNVFDFYPISETERNDKEYFNRKQEMTIFDRDDNNIRFVSFEEINHNEIMRFYVRECVEDKEIRKRLFGILRRFDYVVPFIDALNELDLYEDFLDMCDTIYYQIYDEWVEKNHLDLPKVLSDEFYESIKDC